MQVSERFPAFSKPSLLVTVDSEKVRILTASGRDVAEHSIIRVPVPMVKTDGGHTAVRAAGQTIIRGTRNEPKRLGSFHRLLNLLNAQLLTLLKRQDPQALYLFAPDQLLKSVRGSLSRSLQSRIVLVVPADMTHATPQQLVERIAEERKRLPEKVKATRVPR